MRKITTLLVATALTGMGAAYGQQPVPEDSHVAPTPLVLPEAPQTLSTLPAARTVTNWYKQNIYDPMDNKIAEISDVLIDSEGKIGAFIVSIGGFLGIGEKDVAVPFNVVHASERNSRRWLTMDVSKDVLKEAVGYKYDRGTGTWEHN
jgi:sporulation protein YlmC with PRC-barrel domain